MWRSLRLSFAAGLLTFVLAGCPVPIPPLGYIGVHGNIPDRPSELIVKGKTTRADVLLLLGSPDSQSPDGRRFEYHSELHQGGVMFVIAAGGSGAAALGPEAFLERRLIVGFGARGVVDSVELEDKSCTRAAIAIGSGAGGRSDPCLPVSEGSAIVLQQGPAEEYYVPQSTDVTFEGAGWRPACRASGAMNFYVGRVILTEDALIISGTGTFQRSDAATIRIPLTDIVELVRATHSHLLPEPLWVQVRGGGCVEVDLSKSRYLGLGSPDRTQTEHLIRLLESRLGLVARRP